MLPVCVVLDLDDTLILERDYALSGFAAVGAWARDQLRIDDFGAKAVRAFDAGLRANIFDSVLSECGRQVKSDDVREMVRIYRRHSPRIAMLPDAAAFLDSCRGVVRLCLISDGPVESQWRKMKALRLNKVLSCVVLTDFWGKHFWKPHPRAFRQVQSVTSNTGLQYVYVADNPAKDFETPASMNWRTVRIRRPSGLHASVEAAAPGIPDFEIPDFSSLPRILKQVSRRRFVMARNCS